MDERTYEQLTRAAFERVFALFADVEPEQADVESTGDVVRVELVGGRKVVLNTQRPVRQIWLAGGQSAWHFSYDADSQRWLDDKGRGELLSIVRAVVREVAGLELPANPPG